MMFIIISILLQQICAFTEYTHIARTVTNKSCFTGCDSNSKCLINGITFEYCNKFEIAPIYQTSGYNQPEKKYCLSNCGYFFKTNYEWCYVSQKYEWDYCSSNQYRISSPVSNQISKTIYGKNCKGECYWDGRSHYYWCYVNEYNAEWQQCAPPALPRVPTIQDNWYNDEKQKGNCNGFYQNINITSTRNNLATSDADRYIRDLADAIERAGRLMKHTFTVSDSTPIKSFSMVKVRDIMVPAVIRARITNESLKIGDQSEIPDKIYKKLEQQMAGTNISFEPGLLIGTQLGGRYTSYNAVPRSVNWQCEVWSDMESSVKDWCRGESGGVVDMTVVVFYRDANTPIPSRFGVSLIYT